MDQHPVRGLVGQVSVQQWVPGWIGIISMMDGCEWIYDWRLDLRLSDSLVGGLTDITEWHLSLVGGLDLSWRAAKKSLKFLSRCMALCEWGKLHRA